MQPNTNSTENIEMGLAKPGAGLGVFPTLALKLFIRPFVIAKATRHESRRRFEAINAKILNELEGLTETQLQSKVLVPPIRGLEDSSRYWSINMTLEHLCIVTPNVYDVIRQLSDGFLPSGRVDIAQYKPTGQQPSDVVLTKFREIVEEEFLKLNEQITKNDSKLTFLHPWFGKLSLDGWYWLLGAHHGIHLKQIREIKKRLPLIDR